MALFFLRNKPMISQYNHKRMKINVIKSITILLALILVKANAGSITFPENYEVIKVNGKTYSQSFFASESKVELLSERNVILYRYNELFEDADFDHVNIKSEPYVLLIADSKDTFIVTPPAIKDISQARMYGEKPLLKINNSKQQLVKHQIVSLNDYEKKKFAQIKVEIVEQQDKENAVNLVATANRTANKYKETTKAKLETSRAFDMLNYWWQQASEQEKQAFIRQLQTKGD